MSRFFDRLARHSLAGKILLVALAPNPQSSWLVLVPAVEDGFLKSRKDEIRNLSETAMGILASHEAQAATGSISREEAQRRAVEQIKSIRLLAATTSTLPLSSRCP
jgi:hypothetical protein